MPPDSHRLSSSLDEVERRREDLVKYQDEAYAARYVEPASGALREAQSKVVPESTTAVARYLFRLMACKDEYEVARLYSDGDFIARVAVQFEGHLPTEIPPCTAALVDERDARAPQGSLWSVDAQGEAA